ncbi:MAG: tetratricopeptide repeat protein, partial [bacterium]
QPPSVNIDLLGLDRMSAVRLLRQDNPDLDFEDARRVAEVVADWPLALDQLARCFATQALTPTEFLELAQEVGTTNALEETLDVIRGQVPEEAQLGVARALLASFERLSPEAQRLALVLAQFGTEQIPMELIKALESGIATFRARGDLTTRNFLVGGGGESLGAMHALLADVIRGLDGEGRAREAATAALRRFANNTPADAPAQWHVAARVASHANALLARQRHPGAEFVPLYEWLGQLRLSQGMYREATAAWESLVRLGQQTGLPATELAARRRILAEGRLMAGDLQTALDELRALQAEHPLDPQPGTDAGHVEGLAVAAAVGEAYRGLSRYPEAAAVYEAALPAAEGLVRSQPVRRQLSRGWINFCLQSQRASHLLRPECQAYLDACRTDLGPDDRATLQAQNLLALVLRSEGDLAGARAVFAEQTQRLTALIGAEHPETIARQHNLANLEGRLGNRTTQRDLLEQVVESRRHTLGDDHPLTLDALNDLGLAFWHLGNFDRAAEVFDACYRAQCRVLGPQSVEALRSRGNVAVALHRSGKVAEAEAVFRDVIPLKAACLGIHHSDHLQDLVNLAECCHELGRPGEALEETNRVLTIIEGLAPLAPQLQYELWHIRTLSLLALERPEAGESAVTLLALVAAHPVLQSANPPLEAAILLCGAPRT